jgi:uncharacterized protein
MNTTTIRQFAALAAATLLVTTPLHAQELSIATGGTGGVYFPYGGGLAEVIGRHVEGASASAEVTGASVENVALISRFDSDLALALADTVYQAFHGEGPFEGRQVSELRALGSIYPNAVQIITLADSGITSLDDLRGMRVSVGAPGSGTEVNADAILQANGITYDDIDEQRLNFNETADALGNGDIDAGFWSVGAPTSSILNLSTTNNIVIIALTEEEMAAAIAADPVMSRTTLPGGSYTGIDEDITVLGIPNVLAVSSEMPDDVAYAITRAMFENIADLQAVHPAANETTVEFTMSATPVPLHPGAIRYYEEIGAEIPDNLRQ